MWQLCVAFLCLVCAAHARQDHGRLSDLHLDKFICREGEPCEENPGRQMSWFDLVRHTPSARSLRDHSATTTAEGIYIVGGMVDKQCSSDIVFFDPKDNTFQQVEYTGKFSPRQGHISFLSLDSKILYIFGGHCNGAHFNDLHAFDLESKEMSRVETSGQIPPLTEGIRGVVIGKQLVTFGGCNYIPQRTCSNSVFTLHLEMFVWVEHDTKGDVPEGRDGHALFSDGEQLFVFGGRTQSSTTNELLVIRPGVWTWKSLLSSGSTVPVMQGMSVDVINTTAYLFGGCRPQFEVPEATSPVPSRSRKTGIAPATQGIVSTIKRNETPEPRATEDDDLVGPSISLLETAVHMLPVPPPALGHRVPPAEPGSPRVVAPAPPPRVAPVSDVPVASSVHASDTPFRPGSGVRIRLPRDNELCNSVLYTLDLVALKWTVSKTIGSVPAPREFHAAAVIGRKIFVSGGCQHLHCVADTYMLDTELHCVNNCSSHGDCDGGICACHKLFGGLNCEIDMRCGPNCTNHGVCINALCKCEPGFGGRDCNKDLRCPAECSQHGVCVHAECQCSAPYHGPACNLTTNCPNDCHGRGFCNFGFCYCDPGYSGVDCANVTAPTAVEPEITTGSAMIGAGEGTTGDSNPNNTTSSNGFVFVGANQMCGGSMIVEIGNTSLTSCKSACLSSSVCSHISFFPARSACKTFSANQCSDVWSTSGSFLYVREVLPEVESRAELVKESKQSRLASVSKIQVQQSTKEEDEDNSISGLLRNPNSSSSTGVFVFLALGILIGTVLGVIGKSLWHRGDYTDEYY